MDHITQETNPSTVTIPAAYNGPDGVGNGGYSAGVLAARLSGVGGPAVRVTLRNPVPLERALHLTQNPDNDGLSLTDPDAKEKARTVAEAETADMAGVEDSVPGAPVTVSEAQGAEARYPGHTEHPFAHCYSCGPTREEGDGLRLFPGTVRTEQNPDGGGTTVACTWTPHPVLDDGTGHTDLLQVWAALDCPGGWSSDINGRPIVLGRMTARVAAAPRIGSTHIVTGHLHAVDGRKILTGSALYDGTGRPLAWARATWIALRA